MATFQTGDFVLPRFGKPTLFGVIAEELSDHRCVVRWADDTETIEHESGIVPDLDVNLGLVIDELAALAEAEGLDEMWIED